MSEYVLQVAEIDRFIDTPVECSFKFIVNSGRFNLPVY